MFETLDVVGIKNSRRGGERRKQLQNIESEEEGKSL